jgi:transcriptional regulator with XRE-family HTH domain
MNFGERLTELRKENGYATRNDFANKLGIPSTTLRNYETNAREPGHTFLKQISELFNVSVDYLLCLTDEKEVLNAFRIRSSEKDLIEKYRNLDDHGKEMVDLVLEKEAERSVRISRLNQSSNIHTLPIAAHNDNNDPDQQRLMLEDLEDL